MLNKFCMPWAVSLWHERAGVGNIMIFEPIKAPLCIKVTRDLQDFSGRSRSSPRLRMLRGSQQTTKRLTVAIRRWLRLMFLFSSSTLLSLNSHHQTNIYPVSPRSLYIRRRTTYMFHLRVNPVGVKVVIIRSKCFVPLILQTPWVSAFLTADMIFLGDCGTRYAYGVVWGSWRTRMRRPGRGAGTGGEMWRFQIFSC